MSLKFSLGFVIVRFTIVYIQIKVSEIISNLGLWFIFIFIYHHINCRIFKNINAHIKLFFVTPTSAWISASLATNVVSDFSLSIFTMVQLQIFLCQDLHLCLICNKQTYNFVQLLTDWRRRAAEHHFMQQLTVHRQIAERVNLRSDQ